MRDLGGKKSFKPFLQALSSHVSPLGKGKPIRWRSKTVPRVKGSSLLDWRSFFLHSRWKKKISQKLAEDQARPETEEIHAWELSSFPGEARKRAHLNPFSVSCEIRGPLPSYTGCQKISSVSFSDKSSWVDVGYNHFSGVFSSLYISRRLEATMWMVSRAVRILIPAR